MKYDNLADARAKLQGTLGYCDGRGAFFREIGVRLSKSEPIVEEYYVRVEFLTYDENNPKSCTKNILDPAIGYMKFSIGYINSQAYATWFYRNPVRQYRQGLRHDQMSFQDESAGWRNPHINQFHIFGANSDTGLMLENKYPTFDEALNQLKSKVSSKVAFHKDFAVFTDGLRGDLVLEHKGIPAAFGKNNNQFMCSEEFKFLREAMSELNIKVA